MTINKILKGLLVFSVLSSIAPVYANHPGGKIDEYMEDQEKYFQKIDLPNAPDFRLMDSDGKMVSLSDFKDKVVILNFIFTSCKNACPLHTAVIADIQDKVNITPMKDNVQFLSITTDPENDTPDILRKYEQTHNLDPVNWKFLTTPPDAIESFTRELSAAYNVKFEPVEDGQQVHGAVTHIIDRNGRFAGKFHGLEFGKVNLILYVNGLISNWYTDDSQHDKSLWAKFLELLSLDGN